MKVEYFNLYTHYILTTEGRLPIILEKNRERIEKYITGIVNNLDSKLYSIFINPEHAHLLVSRCPHLSDDLLLTQIAKSSTNFVNKHGLTEKDFSWQQTAAAFSVSKSHVDRVCKYILNQPIHHKKVTFSEEYNGFIKEYQRPLKWDVLIG